MKTVNYEATGKIECPVCHRVLVDENAMGRAGEIHGCKHVLLWHNNICDDFVRIHKSLKEQVKQFRGEQRNFFRKLSSDKTILVYRFIGSYLGGDQYPVDTIAFRK